MLRDVGATQSSARVSCSATHCLALTPGGQVLSWATHPSGDRFGQLCQGTSHRVLDASKQHVAGQVDTAPLAGVTVTAVAAGGSKESGHSLLLGQDGSVWSCGCDRWQQLGLSGATAAGAAAGYAWSDGRIWQPSPKEVRALKEVGGAGAAALGADHSLVVASNGRDVYSWGRGEQGQLGRGGKVFLAAPGRSTVLSAPDGWKVKAVHAADNCSAAVHSLISAPQGQERVVSAGKCAQLLRALRSSAPRAASNLHSDS
jgi:alpha-tubulin suppressor-like RCC1 family protein